MSEGAGAGARGRTADGVGGTTPRRTLLILALVIVVTALIAAASMTWERRDRTITGAGQEMRRLSLVLGGEVARTVQGVDVMLRASAEAYIALSQTEASSTSTVHAILRERATPLFDVVRIHSIVGADGSLLYDSLNNQVPSLWLGDRDFFIAHRDRTARGLYVSAASRLAMSGEWVLTMSRRLEHRDGSFAGVVVAIVNAAHFESLFTNLDLGPGTSVSLVHREGGLIARAPPLPEEVGQIDRQADPRVLLASGAGDTVVGVPGNAGAPARLLAVRALPELPLAVVVGAAQTDLLTGWRQETLWIGSSVALGLVVVLVLMGLLARQISRHEGVAAALAESQRWLDRAQAAANIGSWVTRLSGQDEWSPETYRVLGVDPATFVPSVASFEKLVHPDDVAGYREAARRSIVNGIPYNHVHRIVRPDGTVRWIHSQADIIRNAAGRTVQMIGTVQDVTDRKIAEDALRLSEARLRDYAETASDWYWETGPDDRFTYMSSRIKSFGMDNTVRLGKTRRELAADAGDDPDKWRDLEAIVRRHEPFRDFVYKMALSGERESHVSVSGKPVFGADGRFLGYRGTARDVTAFMQAEEKLREAKTTAETASAAKTSFLANMSHELRTPLNAIIGFAEALSAGYFGGLNTKQTEYVRDIRESGNHLLLLINDLLDVAKIEAGKFELQPEPLDLVQEVQACLRLVMPRATEGNVTIEPQMPAGLPMYRADRRALKQVVLNLLSNAVKFTLPGGRVTVSVRYDPADGAQISVADTGIGIASSDLPKVVLPFGSLARNATLSRRREGTGLGLPLSKSLVEMHGGRLEIVSEVGHGTIATVRLPPQRVSPSVAIPGSTSAAGQR